MGGGSTGGGRGGRARGKRGRHTGRGGQNLMWIEKRSVGSQFDVCSSFQTLEKFDRIGERSLCGDNEGNIVGQLQ